MDGLDISVIDQLDEDVFNGSQMFSDDEDEGLLPLPDCIGIDSAVQDHDEEVRTLRQSGEMDRLKNKTRSELERELELKIGKSSSIRGKILEQSLKEGNNNEDKKNEQHQSSSRNSNNIINSHETRHVMNIVEKAGMQGIDKEKINEIIHEASKGSLFYKKQAQRQEEIHKSIGRMLNKVKNSTSLQVDNAKVVCDKLIKDLEKQRQFNNVVVHFDLDMFFAAVEIRDNPALADKPVAVGGDSMVSTSNYIARRFGVRAAMPGFIARKLCPKLLLIKPNGVKYRQASAEVFEILERYDPDLASMSLDEAYLNLTDYVKGTLERDGIEHDEYYDGTLPRVWWTRSAEIVEEIRQAIFDKTKLTCSAGIACNTLLSKISTDINKPNGQFMVEGYAKDVRDFIASTPVEKVSGIGKVSCQFLHALDIKTCGDIYEKRHFLPLVFYEINVKFYLRVSLGDGSVCVKSDEQRKSKSVERTFTPIKDTLMLLDKLDSICEELCTKYLKPYRIRGRTITIKLKRNTFTTTTKSYSMLVPTNDKMVIYSAAKNLMLSELANEPPEISYRLLGVKLSNLADDGVTTNQMTIDAMLKNQELNAAAAGTKSETSIFNSKETLKNKFTDAELLNSPAAGEPSIKKRPALSQPIALKKKIKKNAKTTPTTRSASTTPIYSSTQCGIAQKVSYYQKFMETNSQTFSQSAKFEPFQCPYCQHGFLSFQLLENHVPICTKKAL